MKLLVTAIVSLFALNALSAVIEKGETKIETKLEYVKLSAEAKCRAPRFEDDGYTVYYSPESYKEIGEYRGYSSKLLGRTCGKSGSTTELSSTKFEKVEVLVYNYGAVRREFDEQVRQAIDGF